MERIDEAQSEILLPEPTERAVVQFTVEPIDEVIEHEQPRWRTETDPELRIDYFFQENARFAEDSHNAWHKIRDLNESTNEAEFFSKCGAHSREERRYIKSAQGGLNRNNVLSTIKNYGQTHYSHARRHFGSNLTYDQFLEQFGAYYQKHLEGYRKELELDGETEKEIEAAVAETGATIAFGHAFHARDTILAHTTELLSDPATVPLFLNRVQEMAEDPQRAEEVPGFLEIIATHVLQEGPQKNILYEAMQKATAGSESYAREFLDHVTSKELKGRGKSVTAILGMMNLMSSIVETDFDVDQTALRDRMAQNVNKWPVDLQTELEIFVRESTHRAWGNIQTALEPFMRAGRLPVQKGIVIKGHYVKRRGNRRGQTKEKDLQLGSKTQDHEAVLEPEKISQFAVVGAKKPNSREQYTVTFTESLEELYNASNLPEYVRKHSQDKTLQPLFKAMLEHLIENPFDRLCVEKLKEVEYELEGDARKGTRRPYRFKPHMLSDVAKGDIALATRVIFDIVRMEGKQTLVIYGAFIKQDIDRMNKLPSRR